MNAKEFARIVWRRKLVALAVAALVVAGGVAFLETQPKVYESQSAVALLPQSSNPDTLPVYSEMVTTLIPTFIQQISAQSFLDQVASMVAFPTSGKQLASQLHPEAVANAGIIKIVADLPSPTQAYQVAQAATQAFLQRNSSVGVVSFKVFNDPQVPDAPVAPRPKLVLGASVLLAVVLGLLGALGWERLFGRVFSAAELAEAAELPVIGIVPDDRVLRDRVQVVVGQEGLGRLEEAMRALRTNFVFAISGSKLRSVVITSIGPAEGKTTIAANLAVVIAELGLQVVLVDGDIHRPRLHELFGLDNEVGLTSTLLERAKPSSLLRPVPAVPNLQVVTSGPSLSDRGEEVNLYLQHLPGFVGLGDVVIVDSPPLRAGADVRLLATSTGAAVLAVRAGSATPRQIRSAVEGLNLLNAKVIGTVLTRSREASDMGETVSYYAGYRRPSEGQAQSVATSG
ncbi:MAG TPA: CpsD/CapB family tyrosine-protein kinase [Acidimicrobiales bacterium]|jgi:succinoglycan biosynthesis transport protein ExoP|nr:CpsD/CapB family tyrosine-protein kinase [Acidimicrobiales bacterium]